MQWTKGILLWRDNKLQLLHIRNCITINEVACDFHHVIDYSFLWKPLRWGIPSFYFFGYTIIIANGSWFTTACRKISYNAHGSVSYARQSRFLASHHRPHLLKPYCLDFNYCPFDVPHPLICMWFWNILFLLWFSVVFCQEKYSLQHNK